MYYNQEIFVSCRWGAADISDLNKVRDEGCCPQTLLSKWFRKLLHEIGREKTSPFKSNSSNQGEMDVLVVIVINVIFTLSAIVKKKCFLIVKSVVCYALFVFVTFRSHTFRYLTKSTTGTVLPNGNC